MKTITILGDSHTRHFAYRNNVFPVFLGAGKNINLDNISLVQSKINQAVRKINNKTEIKDNVIFLYIGEPNCRIKLANHWSPHWDELHHGKKINSEPDKDYIYKSINRYMSLNLSEIDYLITPTGAYDPVVPSLIVFNKLMKEKFGEKVIDIFKYSHSGNKVLDEFKAKDWESDPIHLNSKISDYFFFELYEKGIIKGIDNYNLEIEGHFGTHLLFEKDRTRFGSYIIEDT